MYKQYKSIIWFRHNYEWRFFNFTVNPCIENTKFLLIWEKKLIVVTRNTNFEPKIIQTTTNRFYHMTIRCHYQYIRYPEVSLDVMHMVRLIPFGHVVVQNMSKSNGYYDKCLGMSLVIAHVKVQFVSTDIFRMKGYQFLVLWDYIWRIE